MPRCPDFSTLIKARLAQHILQIHKVEPTSDDLDGSTSKAGKKKYDEGEMKKSSILAEIKLDGDSVSEKSATSNSILESSDSSQNPHLSTAPLPTGGGSTPGSSSNQIRIDMESAIKSEGAKADRASQSPTIFPVFNDDEEEDVRFCCNDCWFATDSKEKLETHCAQKHPAAFEKPEVNNPEEDAADFKSPNGLKNPLPAEAVFRMKCSLCPLDTEDLDEMVNHFGINGHFAFGKTVLCPRCPYIATSSEDLTYHGKSHFDGFSLAQYFCSKCVMVCNTIGKMESHWQFSHLAKK